MKRLLSWIVLMGCSALGCLTLSFLSWLVVRILGLIYADSRILFWVSVVLVGSSGVAVTVAVVAFASWLTVQASHKISQSAKGIRYKVDGIIIIVLGAVSILMVAFGIGTVANPVVSIGFYISSILYGAFILMEGKPERAAGPMFGGNHV